MSGTAGSNPGCLPTGHSKEASGIIVYLMEELGDARLRTAQLKRYVQECLDLVDESQSKDQVMEIAGHLVQGIPDVVFKLDKALDAAALAAARLDYEEIKQNLKPEKAEELENVLRDVRLRYLQRRSYVERVAAGAMVDLYFNYERGVDYRDGSERELQQAIRDLSRDLVDAARMAGNREFGVPHDLLQKLAQHVAALAYNLGSVMAPETSKSATERRTTMSSRTLTANDTAKELENLAQVAESTGQLPVGGLMGLIAHLEKQDRTAGDLPQRAAHFFRQMAQQLRTQPNPSRLKLAASLRRVLADGMQMDAGTMLSSIFQQANSRQDVIDGFMEANPNMSKEDAEKAADMWEKHKNTVKDK